MTAVDGPGYLYAVENWVIIASKPVMRVKIGYVSSLYPIGAPAVA